METSFRKDMSHLTWDEVYARQAKRADLVGGWLDALGLKPGDQVLEIGAGPGYMSLILAERVGRDGAVYAVDRSADALAYLERLQAERGIRHIRRIVADAATLEPTDLHPNSALITMVLHHADDPAGVLRNVARLLLVGALTVIGEFDPDGPGEHGPGGLIAWRRSRSRPGARTPDLRCSTAGTRLRSTTCCWCNAHPDPRLRSLTALKARPIRRRRNFYQCMIAIMWLARTTA